MSADDDGDRRPPEDTRVRFAAERTLLAWVRTGLGLMGFGFVVAGFEAVQVVDTGKDLNAYAKVENQSGCCSPPATSSTGLPILDADGPAGAPNDRNVHGGLAELLRRYDVNEYAASVQVYAVKAR